MTFIDVVGVFFIVFAILSGGMAMWSFRGLRMNNVTYQDRQKLHDWIFEETRDFERRMKLAETVTYDDHLNALMWRKNPWLLYDREIQEQLGAIDP
jgi:hypothetical protein